MSLGSKALVSDVSVLFFMKSSCINVTNKVQEVHREASEDASNNYFYLFLLMPLFSKDALH